MDRQPATWDDAVNAVAVIDHRHDGRIVADAVHAAGYLVPGRLAGGVDDQDRRRQFAACLVRDGLALLLLASPPAPTATPNPDPTDDDGHGRKECKPHRKHKPKHCH
jgi:hypothetical protein